MIRKATKEDIQSLRQVYDEARERMYESGNTKQWSLTYPEREIIESDIEKGWLYVVEEDEEIKAAFTIMDTEEPNYKTIFDGAWPEGEYEYATIHRVAGKRNSHHVLKRAIETAFTVHDVVRIDTHMDNKKMQALIKKYGFTYCGKIVLPDKSLRLSFQKDNRA